MYKSFAELKKRHKSIGGTFFDRGSEEEGGYVVTTAFRRGRFFFVSVPSVGLAPEASRMKIVIAEEYCCYVGLDSGRVYKLHGVVSSSLTSIRDWADRQLEDLVQAIAELETVDSFRTLDDFRAKARVSHSFRFVEERLGEYATDFPVLAHLTSMPENGADWLLA
jgi:hypothetical protein